jgi:hypothetical protein
VVKLEKHHTAAETAKEMEVKKAKYHFIGKINSWNGVRGKLMFTQHGKNFLLLHGIRRCLPYNTRKIAPQ